MKKMPELNALVVMSHEPGATVYRVKEIGDKAVGVIDAAIEDTRPNQTVQWVDRSVVEPLSVGQLRAFTQ